MNPGRELDVLIAEKTSNLEKISIAASICAMIKFMAENVTFTLNGHLVALGHVDPIVYATLLGPLWGAHSYISTKGLAKKEKIDDESK